MTADKAVEMGVTWASGRFISLIHRFSKDVCGYLFRKKKQGYALSFLGVKIFTSFSPTLHNHCSLVQIGNHLLLVYPGEFYSVDCKKAPHRLKPQQLHMHLHRNGLLLPFLFPFQFNYIPKIPLFCSFSKSSTRLESYSSSIKNKMSCFLPEIQWFGCLACTPANHVLEQPNQEIFSEHSAIFPEEPRNFLTTIL